MAFCKSGIVAAGAYLAVEVYFFVYASLHPSGLGYEYIPFAFLSFPWYYVLGYLFVRLSWPEAYAMFAGVLMNALVSYLAFSFFSRRRVLPKVK
ncbi:MAG: hypothetical protein ABSG41_12725 [Bryobacteraceae bacterium]|jgi:hypothetical protein